MCKLKHIRYIYVRFFSNFYYKCSKTLFKNKFFLALNAKIQFKISLVIRLSMILYISVFLRSESRVKYLLDFSKGFTDLLILNCLVISSKTDSTNSI